GHATKFIKSYSYYLEEKAGSFRGVKYDWVRQQDEAVAKFRSMEDETMLVTQTELLQKQIEAAVGCNWDVDSMSDVVLQQGFRFMLAEFFNLFLLGNESIVRILSTAASMLSSGLYFQMDRKNCTKSLQLYKTFVSQTKKMQEIFQNAKNNLPMNVEIPKFNIPPVSLAAKLEDYLNSPDFDDQRQANILKGKMGSSAGTAPKFGENFHSPVAAAPRSPTRNPTQKEKPLIDFFSGMEEEMEGYNKAPTSVGGFDAQWDTAFAQQNAFQNDIQKQIEATNQLLKSTPANGFSGLQNSSPFGPSQPYGQQQTFGQSFGQTPSFPSHTGAAANPFSAALPSAASDSLAAPVFNPFLPAPQQTFGQQPQPANPFSAQDPTPFHDTNGFGNQTRGFNGMTAQAPKPADPFSSLGVGNIMKPQVTGATGYMAG
ncbi:hypothetical protein HDU91_001077, partial [Kappamyces sp. JEL0680]